MTEMAAPSRTPTGRDASPSPPRGPGVGAALTLAAIVIVAAVARFWGLQFGLPLVYARPDELMISDRAITFFRESTLNPEFFDYPSLYLYLTAALYFVYFLCGLVAGWFDSLSTFIESWATHWVPFFLIGRTVGAATGTATVLVVYAIGRRLFDARTGLVAAAFFALAFLHVRDSHYATTDAPMVCLMMIAVLFLVRAYQEGRTRDHVLAGVFAGLAMATKYNAFLLALPMAALVLFRVWDAPGARLEALRRSRVLHLLVPFGAMFLLASPYVLLDFRQFRHDIAALSGLHTAGMTPPEMLGIGWKYHLIFSLRYGLGLPLLVTGLAGLAFLLARRPRIGVLLAVFPIVYYLVAGSGYTVYVRYMIPVVPYLCLAGAALVGVVADCVRRLGRGTVVAVTVALAACVVWPSAESVWRFDRLLVERDSRLVAGDWALAHIPPGSTIYQAGAIYGQLQLESSRPFKYRYWVWDEGSFRVSRRPFRWTNDWPDWIVVQESPLPYAHVSPTVAAKLRHDYALEYALRVVDLNEPRNVYDVQDAFFLPFAGFEKVRRPGPNILIYRRRS